MIRMGCKATFRLSMGTGLMCLLFALSAVTARAESAADYAAPFNFLTQYEPEALTPDADGNFLLKFQISNGGLGNIRVFIPPGAIKININFYAAADARVGMAARYNLPPQCDYSQVSYPYWFCFPWDREGGKLSDMTDTDMRFRNRGGHAFVVDQYYTSPLTEGGWLYLKVLDPDVIYNISVFEYAVIVNGDAYRSWHALNSVPAADGTVLGGCAFTAAPDCSPSSPPTPTTPPTPTPVIVSETRVVVEIDTTENGMGGEKIYRDADLVNHSMVTLSASLKFEGLPSQDVDCFAMIVENGATTFIYRETLFDGPSWMIFRGTDNIYRFRTENIAEKTIWSCNAFDFLNKLKLPPGIFTANRLQFIYAIAPIGEVAMGKYENLRYGIISFLPDE